jgi:alpha-methylacyl-CoA racemase
LLAGMLRWLGETGRWRDQRGVNLLDGGAPFYDSYETADGKYVAIGAIEPQFYARLLEALGLGDDPAFAAQFDMHGWPLLKARLTEIFRTKTREQWCALMEGTDICFAPVLSLAEAPQHPHNVARGAFVEVGGMIQPAPAPRFSATPAAPPRLPPAAGADNERLLRPAAAP